MLNDNLKLNFRLTDILKVAFSIAIVDGGFVIAIQIINFLLSYFGIRLPTDADSIQAFASMYKTLFLISIITMLNLAVIIYRIAGVARGMKYNLATCYKQAFKRWPMLIVLYMLGTMMLSGVGILSATLLRATTVDAIMRYGNLITFIVLSLTPYCIFACIFVIDQEKNPLQAIKSTIDIVKDKLDVRLLMNLSMLYTIPFCLSTLVTIPKFITPYTGLLNTVWGLFCYIVTIVIYTSTTVKVESATDKQAATKVIVI
jgi:hypothetical protein